MTEAKEAIWSTAYIIYFTLTVTATIVGLILVNRFVKKEKTLTLILKITAACLLVAIVANRIAVAYYHIVVLALPEYNWSYLLFNTLCGLSSFMMAILVLFAKPTNILFHVFTYVSIGGPIITACYPDFLAKQGFAEPASYTSLIHHSIALFLCLALLVSKRFKPDIKKWYVYPLTYAVCIVIGLFEMQVLKFPQAMNVDAPMLASLPILTSWWMVGIISTIIVFVFNLLYLHFREHKSFHELFLSLKP